MAKPKKKKKSEEFRVWTEFEIRYLTRNYKVKTSASIARTLGRTKAAVLLKSVKLGLGAKAAARWTDEEISLLKQEYINPQTSLKTLAEKLERPLKGVIKMGRKLGLSRPDIEWSKEEIQFLVKNYKKMSYAHIGETLGISESGVAHYAQRHGLNKNPSITRWAAEDDEFLRNNIATKTHKEIAGALNRSFASVRARVTKLALGKKRDSSGK